MLNASLCINNSGVYVELRMFCRKRPIRKQTFPPSAQDGSDSALMTYYPTHVYNSDVFIDHAHWRSKNEKAARTELLALNAWSASLLRRRSEVR